VMEIITLAQYIGSLGFPIVVAGWLFYERYRFNVALTRTLQRMTETLNAIKDRL